MGFNTLHNFEDIYVTADLHLSNIINRTISLRGFSNPQEHTQYIRNIINSTIKSKSATLYILGDIGFKDEDEELIKFIRSLTPIVKVSVGNHDKEKQLRKLWQMGVIQDCKQAYKIRWNDNLFHLQHLPLLEWEGFYQDAFHCFGHTHGKIKPFLRAMDIGLDANNMQIMNLYDVMNMRKIYHNIDENRESILIKEGWKNG